MRVKMDVSGSGMGPVAVLCRGGNYLMRFINGGVNHVQLSDMELLKQVSLSLLDQLRYTQNTADLLVLKPYALCSINFSGLITAAAWTGGGTINQSYNFQLT
jgi:hypothetical protein